MKFFGKLSVISFIVLLLSSSLVSAGGLIVKPFEETINYGCSTTTVFIETISGVSAPHPVFATANKNEVLSTVASDIEFAPSTSIPAAFTVSIDVKNGAYTDTQFMTISGGTNNFSYPEQTGIVPIEVRIIMNDGLFTKVIPHSLSDALMSVDDIRFAGQRPTEFVFNAVLDCDTGTISLCPDNRLNANLCEPIAIYAIQDSDGSYYITVYQSAPTADVGKYLFELTSEEIATAEAGGILDSDPDGFAKAYLDGNGNIIFEAGPDFEGKIFYYSFSLDSFPNALPTTSTNY